MFSLTLRRPCEADPQLPGAVGLEGLKRNILLAALSRRGSARSLLGLREQPSSRLSPERGQQTGAISVDVLVDRLSSDFWE